MIPKEKEKLFFKNKSIKRTVLLLAFLAIIFSPFNNFGEFSVVYAQSINSGVDSSINSNLQNGSVQNTGQQDGKVLGVVGEAVGTAMGSVSGAGGAYLGGIIGDKAGDKIVDTAVSGLLWALNAFLYGIFLFMGGILRIAAGLFDWAVNAGNFKAVMDMDAITIGWAAVRDFLNLAFILVLLFSAFCTIFQVEKYNIKKILLNLVIMALLVNFSFPISRFIIDSANIPMYHIFKAIGGDQDSISKNIFNSANSKSGGDVGGQKSEPTGIMRVIYPKMDSKIIGDSNQTFRLIAAIVFIFLFAVTILVIAILLVVRIIVLAILVIFSPVGFVASILPSLSKYSSDWWSQLFKQSFFGTIMAFMLYISLMIMQESQKNIVQTIIDKAQNGSTDTEFSDIVVGGATLAIPIVLLWIGLISAQKMGAMGADAVVSRAEKIRKWAGKKFSGYNAFQRQRSAFNAERKKREDEKNKHRWGGSIGKGLNKGEDWVHGHLRKGDRWWTGIPGSKGARKRYDKLKEEERRKDIDDEAKKSEDSKTTIDMVDNVNTNVFASGGVIDTTRKITDKEAGDAKAYTRKSSDDRKDLVADALTGKTSIVGTKFENILAKIPTLPPTDRARIALEQILSGSTNEKHLRTVTTYINRQMEDVTKQYVKQ